MVKYYYYSITNNASITSSEMLKLNTYLKSNNNIILVLTWKSETWNVLYGKKRKEKSIWIKWFSTTENKKKFCSLSKKTPNAKKTWFWKLFVVFGTFWFLISVAAKCKLFAQNWNNFIQKFSRKIVFQNTKNNLIQTMIF